VGPPCPGGPPPASCSWEATNSDFNSWAVAPLTDTMVVPVLNSATSVTLTNGGSQSSAMWAPNLLPTHQSWNASFTVNVAGSAGADGFAFVVHNDPRGASAVGFSGGCLGAIGIVPGVALVVRDYDGNGFGSNYHGGLTNLSAAGALPGVVSGTACNAALPRMLPARIMGHLATGDVRVNVSYDACGCAMSASVFTPGGAANFSERMTVNLADFLGNVATGGVKAASAYVGFTAGKFLLLLRARPPLAPSKRTTRCTKALNPSSSPGPKPCRNGRRGVDAHTNAIPHHAGEHWEMSLLLLRLGKRLAVGEHARVAVGGGRNAQ
jgi:hypothetical protein